MTRDSYCRALRRRSGSVTTRDPRAVVAYRIFGAIADEELEAAMLEAEGAPPFRFTDGFRARQAMDWLRRFDALRKGRG